MRRLLTPAAILSLALSAAACSIAPKPQLTVKDVQRSKSVAYYIIQEDMEGVVKVLNDKGEVVVRSDYLNNPVYLQIFATSGGIEVRRFDRDEYNFSLEDQ